VAIGDGSGRVNTSRGTVQKSGFGDTPPVTTTVIHPRQTDDTAGKIQPAEVISKPTPAYTAEARNLRIEGEVVLEVVFEASGSLRIVKVVQGLGHGLDEEAVRAAQRIRFKPAVRDGQPSDSTALVHIIFQLA
jgi:TonB family protein